MNEQLQEKLKHLRLEFGNERHIRIGELSGEIQKLVENAAKLKEKEKQLKQVLREIKNLRPLIEKKEAEIEFLLSTESTAL